MIQQTHLKTYLRLVVTILFAYSLFSWHARDARADSGPQVKLDATAAAPRSMEDDTQRAIVRDYARAWSVLSRAFEFSSPKLLDGYFVSTARTQLGSAVADQTRGNLVTHYSTQEHNLKAVFYSPEGDVLELHDSVRLTVSLTDGSKSLSEQSETRNYVVLMTPAADRWVVRQIQQVQHF
jgi:hypothetical protein